MATFTALNIEYDNATDEEIDDTKEIQIEDALKLYQTALKYHAEGPASFPQALDAYTELFQSEIFKYPESQSQLRRQELYGVATEFDDAFEEDFTSGPVQLVATGESAPNTLPQILHLAYKNHGQLILDMLDAKIRRERDANAEDLRRNARSVAKSALLHFSEALDKDDTDLDLWSRSAAVGALVGSERVSRYCLEAILDDEDEGVNGVLALPGVAEGFAIHKLREEVRQLQDDLALSLQPLARLHKKRIAQELLRKMTPYISIQLPAAPTEQTVTTTGERLVLQPAQRSWEAIGDAILRQYHSEQNGFVHQPGAAVSIDAPLKRDSQDAPVNKSPVRRTLTTDAAGTQDAGAMETTQDISDPTELPTNAASLETAETVAAKEDAERPPDAKEELTGEADGNPDTLEEVAEENQQESRKRSSASAGLQEEEGTRTRSKRLKARESIAEKVETIDIAAAERQNATERLQPFNDADEATFETVGAIFEKLGVESFGSADAMSEILNPEVSTSANEGPDMTTAVRDLRAVAEHIVPETVGILLEPTSTDPLGNNSREAGLNAFLGFTKSAAGKGKSRPGLGSDDTLDHWLTQVDQSWLSINELALMWIHHMLQQVALDDADSVQPSTYRRFQWTDELKRTIVQLVVHLDETLLRQLADQLSTLERKMLDNESRHAPHKWSSDDEALVEMVETLFELHLDVFSLIKQPGAGVDAVTQVQAKDRLERWSAVAHQALQLRTATTKADVFDELTVRHLWATAFHLSVCDDVEQEHVILCMHQLKLLLEAREGEQIELQNNAVMPELSVQAIERELSRIQMKDFFLKVFADDEKDPVNTIEMLEPILELGLGSSSVTSRANSVATLDGSQSQMETVLSAGEGEPEEREDALAKQHAFSEMSKFLESSTVSLKLSLWQRLREAYEAIDYQPKVVSCYLRCIELLVHEMKSTAYRSAAKEQRHFMLLRWLRLIDDILIKVLAKTSTISGNSTHLDCIDNVHLRSSMTALAELSKLLHTFNLFEDSVRVGLTAPPTSEGRAKQTFGVLGGKIHDMQLRLWMLSYALLKEGMTQAPETFPNPNQVKVDFLRSVHGGIGVRGYCKASNKAFLRLLKEELLHVSGVEGVDHELSQALYDLYGIKCCPDAADVVDHGAPPTSYEPLTKKTAAKVVDFVMAQASKVPPKDLPKLELKNAIDKVHAALGKSKTNDATQANKRAINAYLKSAIPPLELFRCLNAIGSIASQPVSADDFPAAAKGWYFLMGDMALNKYLVTKQKNVASTTNDDLIIAVAFFMQDLEFDFSRWETWYCLAQCYELQLEEAVMFSAEKINNGSLELQAFQRSAVHCYTMGIAGAMTLQDASDDTLSKIAKMYSDFATRIYASSRQPFSMEVFKPRDTEARFFSKPDEMQTPMRGYAFYGLQPYTAWKFAAALYRRAISRFPHKWWNHYMLGKCLWKMYTADDAVRNYGRFAGSENYRPSVQELIETLTTAVETIPQKKENRREREPILEPHYKIVAIAHKLVLRKDLDVAAAADMVQVSDICSKVPKCKDLDEWDFYVIQLLKALRAVDKANWHHRMTARAAHVIYDATGDEVAAMGAKHELTQQIFTRTMAVQVWKPENERPGRHFVYTTRYTRFFVKILCQLDDRVNMDALSKRLRRKPQDFCDHGELWREFCVSYLKLLRRWGRIPEGHEDAVFKSLNHEDFVGRAVRLEMWCQNPNTKSPLLDVLRDVIELKKVNNGLMKATLIDDLVGDTYAKIYAEVGPSLEEVPLPPDVAAQLVAQGGSSKAAAAQIDGAVDPTATHSGQEAPGRPRAKGVGRRELQRRAEAAVTPPVRAAPTLPVRTSSSAQVVITSSVPPPSLAPSVSGAATATNSAPPSVQGDADNDSELSELDEVEEPEQEEVIAVKPLFPNLRRESPTKNTSPAADPGPETKPDGAQQTDDGGQMEAQDSRARSVEANGETGPSRQVE